MPKYGERTAGATSFSAEQALDYWSRKWRIEYLAPQPPAKRDETIERARRLAAERPGSYLALRLWALYGVTL